jgi:outer membrane protein OmpA-like peptidoglycan-associated protein
MPPDYHTPLQVLGARRAVEIARRARAERDAPNELKEAENRLAVLEQIWQPNRDDDKKFGGEAREVMRLAEAARTQAIERAEAERLSAEPRAAERAISRAESEAEQARAAAAQAKRRAEEYRALLSRTESELAAARQRAGQAQTEADRAKANEDARLEAERARLEAERTRRERDAAMQRLQVSLSEILETRREARGLIVNLSDVLFDFNKASLKPGAKEKLSKLTGVLLAYPGSLRIEIEGHTDSVGTHEYNQKLSEERVASVRSYLLQAGMSADKITAVYGFGETRPVATNDTDVGRQMNRRVEIVIVDTNAPTAASNR